MPRLAVNSILHGATVIITRAEKRHALRSEDFDFDLPFALALRPVGGFTWRGRSDKRGLGGIDNTVDVDAFFVSDKGLRAHPTACTTMSDEWQLRDTGASVCSRTESRQQQRLQRQRAPPYPLQPSLLVPSASPRVVNNTATVGCTGRIIITRKKL